MALARIAMLNAESDAYVASHEARVDALLVEMPPERLSELQDQYPDECAAIFDAAPDADVLATLDILIHQLGNFTSLPAEDRGYVAEAFRQLHEVRSRLLDGDFLSAWRGTIDCSERLHWVARMRKRNNTRAAHRMPDPHILDEIDRVSQRVSLWGERLQRPMEVV
jgi:hypothetical protein